MSVIDRWSVELLLFESGGETHAEARLITRDTDNLRGDGRARRNPADPNVLEIGEEVAVARALADLAHKLLDVAAVDIESVTHERARLHL